MTVNIRANAPQVFRNNSRRTVHMLCMCTPAGRPAGREEFFTTVGNPIQSRSAVPAKHTPEEQAEAGKLVVQLLAEYRTGMVKA